MSNIVNFSSEFFTQNRHKLASCLPNSLIVITAHCELQSSADLAHPFRQDQSFWYLCGLNIPEVVLTIDTASSEHVLFLPELTDYQKEWDGGHSETAITQTSGINNFRPLSELAEYVRMQVKSGLQICSLQPLEERVEPYGFYANPARNNLYSVLQQATKDPITDVRSEIARQRAVKQSIELEAIKRAIAITAESLAHVRASLQKYRTEKDLENAISSEFYRRGADGHAYTPIVASGANSSIIHYNKNRDLISKNSLILLDVGARYEGYCADISRVWSIGSPSKRQVDIHKAVSVLRELALSKIKAGMSLKDYQKDLEKEAHIQMRKLHMAEADKPYPHGFSHFLGLDVHDAGMYDEPLKEGAVITVEPGLYSTVEGIGVRIEDNVLVTKNGFVNLSKNIPLQLV